MCGSSFFISFELLLRPLLMFGIPSVAVLFRDISSSPVLCKFIDIILVDLAFVTISEYVP